MLISKRWNALSLFLVILRVLLSVPVNHKTPLDPTEFFKGSQHRPTLEILEPENGQVLNGATLHIRLQVKGYEVPSHFHDSSICISLSTKAGEAGSNCFDQSSDLTFHINGLSPGETYSLRVIFLERGKTIAMSIRTFRVGGVVGILEDATKAVSIETALQVAVKAQVKGVYEQAEKIYRSILSQNPSHPFALHLLGVVFIQKGTKAFLLSFSLPMSPLPLTPAPLTLASHRRAFSCSPLY